MKSLLFFIIGIMTTHSLLQAQNLKLPRLIGDHMVYQRNQPIKLWGWDNPGQNVTVSFAETSELTTTNNEGYWQLYLPEQVAGGPFQIRIQGSDTITVNDVYFGDVWVAGGQSNMEWKLSWGVQNWEQEVIDSDFPEIRFFEVPNALSLTKENTIKGGSWMVANPKNSPDFSAVAWFFAKLNHLEQGVPVGIIDANWGGTPAEAWTPATDLLSKEGYKESAEEMLSPEIDWDQRLELNNQNTEEKYRRVNDTSDFLSYGAHEPSFDDSDWKEIQLPNSEALHDFVWLRKSIQLTGTQHAKLSFGNPGKFSVVFINGQKVYTKIWSDDPEIIILDSAVLRKGENSIAIRTVEDWDNRTFIGSSTDFWLQTDTDNISLEGSWKFSNTIEPPMPETIRYEHSPGTLFNAMIYPITATPIRGVIWYQGESNVGMNEYYRDLFSTMITSWKHAWNSDFPFLFVQLANYLERKKEPTESDWAKLREAQTQTLALDYTGMAVTIDIGDAEDIHPRNKKDVGYRLWQNAKKIVYGEDVIHSGPVYKSHTIVDDVIEVHFDHAQNGWEILDSDHIEGFAIAGSDSVFHWATAEIHGQIIRVFSDHVKSPMAVRYAWADNPKVSLYNKEGLPVVPFRTDDW